MVDDKISKINEYLKEQLWMDFEMCSMSRGGLELYGFLDESGEDKIKIVFEQPFMISCNLFFTYEGNQNNFISVVDGEEAFQINKKYDVTQGNIVFKISNTNVVADMIIIAKGVEVIITE